jgi:cytoskeletal protein RodZ
MSEKNTNRISLFIGVVAVALILGGVYVLNRMITTPTTPSTPTKSVAKTTSPKTISPSNSDNTSSSSPGQSTSTDIGKTAPTSSSNSTTSDSTSSTPTSIPPTQSTTTPQASTTLTTNATSNGATAQPSTASASTSTTEKKVEPQKLAFNELTARFIDGTQTWGKFEIVDCGLEGSTFCAAPYKFYVSYLGKWGVTPEYGKTYKFIADIQEDQNGFSFKRIEAISEVQ